MKMDIAEIKRPEASHIWQREEHEHYVEPEWCSTRLFVHEIFEGVIWDPCCGFGRIPKAAEAAGYEVMASDIVDRGHKPMTGQFDFLTVPNVRCWDNIVCNPPFNVARNFAERSLAIAKKKVAMIFPTARLNAARWLDETPLANVWLLTPRPAMPPGCVVSHGVGLHGEPQKVGGGKMDFCWLVWDQKFTGAPTLRWLHRDSR